MMTTVGSATALEELQRFRSTNERASEKVAQLGWRLIKEKYPSKAGDQVWPFYEQVAIAAFDVKDFELADYCIEKLKSRFTEKSLRFRRLLGMQCEATGRLDEAQRFYDSILTEDETNMLASKRQIALLKEKDDAKTIEALTRYLDIYYDDYEAWLELCDVYLSNYFYEQASYCCEEMMLLQPGNHITLLKYAEIMYTSDQITTALKYYCKVLEVSKDNLRALYGLHMCAGKLLGSETVTHASSLQILATERLLEVYKKSEASTFRDILADYMKQPVK